MATLRDIKPASKPKTVFTARKKNDTDEIHLFEGTMQPDGKCHTGARSVCERMARGEGVDMPFQCKDDTVARMECAKLGRAVCGTCVSTLYTTYD